MSDSRRYAPASLAAMVLAIATIGALGAGEVIARIVDPVPTSIYEPDSTRLYRLVPNSHKNSAAPGSDFVIDINSLGYRGREFALASTKRRVALFGDSFIAGEFSPLSDTFAEQLRTTLSKHHNDSIEVVNLGVAGYGPDQSLLRMRDELARLKPDVVILALFPFNDFGDLLRNKLFAVNTEGTLVPRGGYLTDSMSAAFSRTAHPSGWRRLHLVRLAERALDNRRRRAYVRSRTPSPAREFTAKALFINDSTRKAYDNPADSLVGPEVFLDEYDGDISITPDSPGAARKTTLMLAVLKAARDEASRAGIPLVVLVIPAPEDICPGYQRHPDSTAFPGYVRSRLTDTAERLAREAQLPVFNLWSPFVQAGPCPLYFKRGEVHWNSDGQALGARLFADSLDAWKLIPDKARAR